MAAIHQKDTPPVGVPILKAHGRRKLLAALTAGLLLVAATVGAALATRRQLQRLMAAADTSPLEGAQQSFDQLLEGLRQQTLAQARMLVDDTRVRTTVITPQFDAATVGDVLDDLRTAAQATGLALLDSGGRPRAVSGVPALRGVDLSSSAAVRTAQDRPTVDVWTVGNQVLVIALAPVRNRREVPALLLVANELPAAALAAVARAHRVSGALVIAHRIAARTPTDGTPAAALQAVAGQAGPAGEVIAGERTFRYRTSQTGDAATAGRVIWLASNHRLLTAADPLSNLVWMPVVMAALLWLLLVTVARALVRR